MSRDIIMETKELPRFTLFWGGTIRKQCLQLTRYEGMAKNHQFITIPVRNIGQLIKRLEKVMKWAKEEK